MPHFPKLWPEGLADGLHPPSHDELEQIDVNVAKSINGDDGGLWTPASLVQATSGWTFNEASIAAQPTPLVDADGGYNAIYLIDDTNNTQHNFFQRLPSLVTGATYVFSTFAKKNGVRYVWFGQDGPNYIYFDLQAGTVGAAGGTASGTIVSVGNGWYYCTATLPNFTTDRIFVGISTANGSATYAGAGTGVLFYKTLVELNTDSLKRKAIVIGGAGLQPTLTPSKNFLFGEPGGLRVLTRRIPALPATLKSGGGLATSGAFVQGLGNGEAFTKQLFLNDLPDNAQLLSVKPYFSVAFGHSSLPILPSLSVKRTTITSGVSDELRFAGPMQFPNPGGPSGGVEFYMSPPPGPDVYPTSGGTGAIQNWTYTADQNNLIDHATYFYTMVLTDEQGGFAIPGNIYRGFDLRFAVSDFRPA